MALPPPFSKPSALSCQRISIAPDSSQSATDETSKSTSNETLDEVLSHLPDEPSIDLDKAAVDAFLVSELNTPVLNELYDHLWCVARRSGQSIDPLHKQKMKGRSIVATEDAGLHLVWYRDKIHIKPIPLCLLNYNFWAEFLSTSTGTAFDRATAIGFMRSYSLLVRHRVDFVLAKESHLFPAEFDWINWAKFIDPFRKIEDEDVSNRYHYGQLRLSRLDWAVRMFRPSSAATKWFYEVPHWSTGTYMGRAIAPLLFGFASLSLILSSMQVLLSVPDENLKLYNVGDLSLVHMKRAFWGFSVTVLLLSAAVWILIFVIPFSALIWQLSWGFENRNKPRLDTKRSLRQKGTHSDVSEC